jgi:hypothetical protein
MGTENIWLVCLGGLSSFLGCCCYAMGGTQGFGLFWRRFIGSFILVLSCNLIAVYLHTWSDKMLLMYPCLVGGMCLGYGGELLFQKIYKRTIFALGCCFTGFIGAWATGFTGAGIGICIFQLIIGMGSVYLGVRNPYNNAVVEQFIISLLLTFTIPFWGFIG